MKFIFTSLRCPLTQTIDTLILSGLSEPTKKMESFDRAFSIRPPSQRVQDLFPNEEVETLSPQPQTHRLGYIHRIQGAAPDRNIRKNHQCGGTRSRCRTANQQFQVGFRGQYLITLMEISQGISHIVETWCAKISQTIISMKREVCFFTKVE